MKVAMLFLLLALVAFSCMSCIEAANSEVNNFELSLEREDRGFSDALKKAVVSKLINIRELPSKSLSFECLILDQTDVKIYSD